MKNKYYFFKSLYPKYVIILVSKGKYKSYNYDLLLMKYIDKKDINYIIVYNDFKVKIVKRETNNYDKYLIRKYLLSMIGNGYNS